MSRPRGMMLSLLVLMASMTLVAQTDRELGVAPQNPSTNAVAGATNAWPAALAPAVREFEAKCAAKTATRGDLIALKKFIAASAVEGALKTNLTRQVRMMYQRMKKGRRLRSEVKGQRSNNGI